MTKPRKRFGQHFLRDQNIINKIVSSFQLLAIDRCIEIGPGEGVLTQHIIEQCQQLTVIEIDRDLQALCQRKFGDREHFHLVPQDVLKVDLAGLESESNPPPWRVVGNLPYNISTPLLFHLLKFKPLIQDMHFMLQKEVIDRIVAKPGSKAYGRLSVMMQFHCQVQSLFIIGPNAFYPPPKVDSAIIKLIPHAPSPYDVNESRFSDIVRHAFAHRRKTLSNNLKGILTTAQLTQAGISPSARAETLSLEDYIRIVQS